MVQKDVNICFLCHRKTMEGICIILWSHVLCFVKAAVTYVQILWVTYYCNHRSQKCPFFTCLQFCEEFTFPGGRELSSGVTQSLNAYQNVLLYLFSCSLLVSHNPKRFRQMTSPRLIKSSILRHTFKFFKNREQVKKDTLFCDFLITVKRYPQYLNACHRKFHEAKHMYR